MYINVDNLFKAEIDPRNLALLFVIKDNVKNDRSEQIGKLIQSDEDLDSLKEKGFIKYIKGKKGDSDLQRLRLDKKAKQFIKSLSEVEANEDDKKFQKWLVNKYKDEGKKIRNKKKLLRLIAWFREETGIDRNKLAFLIQDFIGEQEENNFKYSHDVNNVFWKPENVYQTRFDLSNSRLYHHYQSKKYFFDQRFKKL